MKSYIYVVMEDSQVFSYGELLGGEFGPIAAFSSKEEAEAIALLKRRSAERHSDEYINGEVPNYYVVRIRSYS